MYYAINAGPFFSLDPSGPHGTSEYSRLWSLAHKYHKPIQVSDSFATEVYAVVRFIMHAMGALLFTTKACRV